MPVENVRQISGKQLLLSGLRFLYKWSDQRCMFMFITLRICLIKLKYSSLPNNIVLIFFFHILVCIGFFLLLVACVFGYCIFYIYAIVHITICFNMNHEYTCMNILTLQNLRNLKGKIKQYLIAEYHVLYFGDFIRISQPYYKYRVCLNSLIASKHSLHSGTITHCVSLYVQLLLRTLSLNVYYF